MINWLPKKSGERCLHFLVPRGVHTVHENVLIKNMAFNRQKAKTIGTLCMIIACLDDEEEDEEEGWEEENREGPIQAS